jgi:6-phosphogluconolactonase
VDGNAVIAFARAADGRLSAPEGFATGGTGTGGGLGSQGAVIVDDAGRYLYAVNAGSDSIISFRITPHGLARVDLEPSNGDRPTSVTVDGDLLYVLNAGSNEITGFRVGGGELAPISGSTRPTSGPTAAPGQVSFTPDGDQPIVAERGAQLLGVYPVDAAGVAGSSTFVASSGAVPFGSDFDNKGHVMVSEVAGAPGRQRRLLVRDRRRRPRPDQRVGAHHRGRRVLDRHHHQRQVRLLRQCRHGVRHRLPRRRERLAHHPRRERQDRRGSRRRHRPRREPYSQYLYGRLGGNGTVGIWAIAADGSLTDLGPVPGLPAGTAGIAAT